jgi:hypothetical protein
MKRPRPIPVVVQDLAEGNVGFFLLGSVPRPGVQGQNQHPRSGRKIVRPDPSWLCHIYKCGLRQTIRETLPAGHRLPEDILYRLQSRISCHDFTAAFVPLRPQRRGVSCRQNYDGTTFGGPLAVVRGTASQKPRRCWRSA